MAIEDILSDLEEEFQKKKAEILEQTEKEKEKILTEGKTEIEKTRKGISQQAKREADNQRNQILTAARLESRQRILQAKQDLIERVYQQVLKKIQALPPEKYKELMKKLLIKQAMDLPGQTREVEILVSEQDKNIFTKKFVDEINNELETKNIRITIGSKYLPISGGFTLKYRKSEIDNSLPTLLRGWRENTQAEVVNRLFGER